MDDVEQSGRQLVAGFFGAIEKGELEAVAGLVHADVVMEWPQSGERFRGRDNVIGAMKAQTNKPEVAGEARIVGSGDIWVLMVPLRYSEGIYHYVSVFGLDEGQIHRITEYFGAPFPAQEFRAKYLDRG
jgi:hypothetical protein